MIDDSLIQAIPDFVAFLRRDGIVLEHVGGKRLGFESADGPLAGRSIEDIWPAEVAAQIRQLVRRTLANRDSATLEFAQQGRRYEARIRAHGRERSLCVIREIDVVAPQTEREGVRSGAIEKREFFETLKQSIADATLRERRLAVCVVHIDGLDNINRHIDYSIGQQVLATLLQRLTSSQDGSDGRAATWRASTIGDSVFGAVIQGFLDRDALHGIATDLRRSLCAPVIVGDANFAVTPSVGVALLGEDGMLPAQLLDHAQTAMLEARRGASEGLHFYSDTLKLRSLARLDFQRELREAIAADEFALRYAPRCDLATGRLVAVNAYLRWPSSLRRDIKPGDFLPVAESTGLALDLSRWALRRLRSDLPALQALGHGELRISFGALRQHFASDVLIEDVCDWLGSGEIVAQSLELRLSERVLSGLSSPGRVLRAFHERNVALVVDEIGRAHSSLTRLARMPLWGLQIDRGLITSAKRDAVSANAARAAISVARALDLVPIASGIDDEDDRNRWRESGCVQGLGDCFGSAIGAAEPATAPPTRKRARR